MASVGQAMAAGRRNGRVKFFNSQKGYGFIIPHHQDSGENIEIFVHHTAIHNDGGFKSLGEGEEVEYDLMPGPKGMQAANVTGPGGVSVKGDPNAGRRDPFGGYGGVQAQPGYMQSYGQGFQTGQQRATGQQYPLGGGQQFPGQQPGGSQSANSYNMYGGSPYVYSPPSYGQPYAAASQSGYSASGQSSGGTFNPQAYGGQGAGYPGQPRGGAGGGVSTGGGGGGSGYQPYYQQGNTPSQGQGFFYTPQGSGPTNGNLPQQ